MIFVGVSYGVRVGSHIGVDALVKLMAPGKRKVVSVLAVLLSLVYVGFVLTGSMEYVLKMQRGRHRARRHADRALAGAGRDAAGHGADRLSLSADSLST